MELTEATQLLTWLDQQQRQDAARLSGLQSDMAAQQAVVNDLSRRMEELVGQLMRVETELSRFAEIEKLLDQVKTDLLDRLADEAAAREALDAARQGSTGQLQTALQDLAQLVQGLRTEHDQTRNLLSSNIAPTLQQQVTNNEELAKIVQGLQADLSQTRKNLTQAIGPTLESQGQQIAALARDLQEAQARLTRTQTLAGKLAQRTAHQNELIAGLTRQIQAVQTDVVSTQAQLVRFPQIENALTQAKVEITALVRETERRLNEAAAQAAEMRHKERQADHEAMALIQQQVDTLPRLVERQDAATAENRRLSDAIQHLDARGAELSKAIQQKTERLLFVEERLTHESERVAELEQIAQALARDIVERTTRVPFLDEQLTRDQGRIDGLDLLTASLQRELEELAVRIPLLDEHLTKHGHRLDFLEAEQPKLQKRDEEAAAKIRFLDEWAQRSAEKIDELERFEERLKREQADLVEMQKRHDTQVDQQLAQWAQDLAQFRAQLEAWSREQRRFAGQYDAAQAMLAQIEELAQQLGRDQKQVQEMQRLDMEAQRRELEEWKQANDKRWQLFENKYSWDRSQQAKLDETYGKRLEQLETWRTQDIARADGMEKQAANRHQELLDHLAELWVFQEDWARRQMAELKWWFEHFEESRLAPPSPSRGRPGPPPRITPYQPQVSGPKDT